MVPNHALCAGWNLAVMKIEPQPNGPFFSRRRGNLLSRVVSALANLRIEIIPADRNPEFLLSGANAVIKLPRGGGGGMPDGFEEETLDVVNSDNAPGTRVFLTKEAE